MSGDTGISPHADATTSVGAQARRLGREPVGRWVRGVVGGAALLWLGVWTFNAVTFPARVPMHWGSSSAPDGYASKPVALAVWLVITLVATVWIPFLSRLTYLGQGYVHVPDAEWWFAEPTRMQRLERLVREMVWLLVAWMVAFFALMQALTAVAVRRGDQLPVAAFLALMVAALAILCIGLWAVGARRMHRFQRNDGSRRSSGGTI